MPPVLLKLPLGGDPILFAGASALGSQPGPYSPILVTSEWSTLALGTTLKCEPPSVLLTSIDSEMGSGNFFFWGLAPFLLPGLPSALAALARLFLAFFYSSIGQPSPISSIAKK